MYVHMYIRDGQSYLMDVHAPIQIKESHAHMCTLKKNETLQLILNVFGEENTCQLIKHFNDLWNNNFTVHQMKIQ